MFLDDRNRIRAALDRMRGLRSFRVSGELAVVVRAALEAYLAQGTEPSRRHPLEALYSVEEWTPDGAKIVTCHALAGNITLGQLAYQHMVKQMPGARLTLRQGIRVISEHDPKRSSIVSI